MEPTSILALILVGLSYGLSQMHEDHKEEKDKQIIEDPWD